MSDPMLALMMQRANQRTEADKARHYGDLKAQQLIYSLAPTRKV